MCVLQNRLVFDQILTHLNINDSTNTIIALKFDVEYLLRFLRIETFTKRSDIRQTFITGRLLRRCLFQISKTDVCENFETIWGYLQFRHIPERFFIEHHDLMCDEKLAELKWYSTTFDSNQYAKIRKIKSERHFSENFHNTFPNYKNIKKCHSYPECDENVKIYGQLCDNCTKNKCYRCGYVDLPELIYDHGCCSECLGCSQYDD